jgi:hypothetical protein
MICPYNRKTEVQSLRWEQQFREEDSADVKSLTQVCQTDFTMMECQKEECGAWHNGRCCYASVNLNNE